MTTVDPGVDDRPEDTHPPVGPASYRWDLDVLRVAAILGVVAIHVYGLILGHERLRGTQTWWFALIADIGAIWAVPVFVMISGCLLLPRRAHARGTGAFLRRRAARLLPALVVWHAVYLLLVRHQLMGEDLDAKLVFVQIAVDGRVYTAMYFLWLILGLYFIAPVFSAFIDDDTRRARITAVVACAWTAAVVALPLIATQLENPRSRTESALTMWILYTGLFVAGFAWREPRRTGLRWLWTGLAAVVLLAITIWQYDATPAHVWLNALTPVGAYTPLVTVAAICIFICVIDMCARLDPSARVQKVLRVLGEATFGVFLCHLVFVAIFRKWESDFYQDPTPLAKTQLYLAVVMLSFAVSLVARRIPLVRRVF